MAYLIVYVFGIFLNGIVAGTLHDEGHKKLAARLLLLTPVWPLSAVYGLCIGIRILWKNAELGRRETK